MQIFSWFTNHTYKLHLLFIIFISFQAHAIEFGQSDNLSSSQSYSVEYLTGVSDMHGMRLAYRPQYFYQFDLPLLGKSVIKWEGSIILFDLHGSAKNEATYGASVSPIILKKLDWFNDYPMIFEAGIGVAYVHRKKFGGMNIGSYYQFEDRLGLFTILGRDESHRIGLRLIHYSNGGLNTKNPGLDFVSFVYQKQF